MDSLKVGTVAQNCFEIKHIFWYLFFKLVLYLSNCVWVYSSLITTVPNNTVTKIETQITENSSW